MCASGPGEENDATRFAIVGINGKTWDMMQALEHLGHIYLYTQIAHHPNDMMVKAPLRIAFETFWVNA